jgi:hypothetical protein
VARFPDVVTGPAGKEVFRGGLNRWRELDITPAPIELRHRGVRQHDAEQHFVVHTHSQRSFGFSEQGPGDPLVPSARMDFEMFQHWHATKPLAENRLLSGLKAQVDNTDGSTALPSLDDAVLELRSHERRTWK